MLALLRVPRVAHDPVTPVLDAEPVASLARPPVRFLPLHQVQSGSQRWQPLSFLGTVEFGVEILSACRLFVPLAPQSGATIPHSDPKSSPFSMLRIGLQFAVAAIWGIFGVLGGIRARSPKILQTCLPTDKIATALSLETRACLGFH
jgi:hypothetical protein